MKLFHIASFSGNVGDIVNHIGFYEDVIQHEADVIPLEIRRFYYNCGECTFDSRLADEINSSDGLILGGGGFFDVRWEQSNTGTTLDMSDEFIDKINVPVLINAMGVHFDDSNNEIISKFERFIHIIQNKDNWMITIRNDGSRNRLLSKTCIFDDKIRVVPDNAFAVKNSSYDSNSNIVGMAISNDLFSEEYNIGINSESFFDEIAKVCLYLLNSGRELLFFLHAPQDLRTLSDLEIKLGNGRFREKIRIAPYDVYTNSGALNYNELYGKCRFVINMRFHGNVIAIKNYVPAIGLAGHEQIQGLYEEIGLKNQLVVVKKGFSDQLIQMCEYIYNNSALLSDRQKAIMKTICKNHQDYAKVARRFLGLI